MARIAVVGAGFTGATIANLLAPSHDVTVFEERPVIGGMAYTERRNGIMVHARGPHIFHTKHDHVRDYVQKFGKWESFDLRVKSAANGQVYSGPPINLHTINQFFGTNMTGAHARHDLQGHYPGGSTFEAAALEAVASQLYEVFFRNYTRKQWGRDPKTLSAEIFARIPIRFNYDDRKYPREEWQAIPVEGYTQTIENMLRGIEVRLGSSLRPGSWRGYEHIFWTGPLDQYFNYCEGRLPYRTLDFVHEEHVGDYQGCPVMNYPGDESWTRITEHKHFAPWESHDCTIITKEIPREAGPGDALYYPVDLEEGRERVLAYKARAAAEAAHTTFVGRLGTFRYIDMDQAIFEAIECVRKFQS